MLEIGSVAPSLRLQNQDGEWIDLAALRKWVVVYFYPRDSTPGCTTEACDFRDRFPGFCTKSAMVLGVSKDSASSHTKFRDRQALPFDLLVDADGQVCQAWGVWQLKKFMGREGMGIVRSTFLIDPQGRIVKVWSPVKLKGHVQEVLDSL